MEKTLVIIKPDGIKKRLVGEIIKRIENKGLTITKIKTIKLNRKKCEKLYEDSMKRFPQIKEPLIKYMTESPVIVLIAEGKNAIKKVREVRGLSDPSKSPKGTIRRDFAGDQKMEELTKKGKATKNVMHSSGNKKEVKFEINLFFK